MGKNLLSLINQLKAQQRSTRLCPNNFAVDALIKSGFDSTHKIESITKEEFIAETAHLFDGNWSIDCSCGRNPYVFGQIGLYAENRSESGKASVYQNKQCCADDSG
jgi:hypothetical protein